MLCVSVILFCLREGLASIFWALSQMSHLLVCCLVSMVPGLCQNPAVVLARNWAQHSGSTQLGRFGSLMEPASVSTSGRTVRTVLPGARRVTFGLVLRSICHLSRKGVPVAPLISGAPQGAHDGSDIGTSAESVPSLGLVEIRQSQRKER